MAEKILIVDDDLDTLRLVGLMLQRQGYEIVAANSGEQAVTMAQGENPELILLDVMMPDMDGVEVTRRLRAEPSTRDIPIIMFTAKTQVEDKILGFEAGADDYLTKPTQPRELFAHVKAVLARTSKTKAPPTQLGEKGSMVGIIAARGGLGVSTLALNLGVSLYTSTKKDVLVAEFRPGLGTISQELGYLRPEGLSHLLQQKANEISVNAIESELITHTSGVRFLLASPQPSDAKLNSVVENFTAIAKNLPYLARYVILDLGTALSPVNIKVTPLCDEVIVVVEPVPQTLQQTKLLINDLASIGIGAGRLSIVLVNRVRSGMQLSWSQVQDQLGENIAVIFTPAPELAYQATMNNMPMVLEQPESLTVQQYAKLAEKVAQLR
jgi:CheY-like chemotaxis protein/MinD-like ATPase involved in chromosome partitioning or flagellar assembly